MRRVVRLVAAVVLCAVVCEGADDLSCYKLDKVYSSSKDTCLDCLSPQGTNANWLEAQGMQYLYVSNAVSWLDAYQKCRTHGATLASPATPLAANVLERMSGSPAIGIWVGLYNRTYLPPPATATGVCRVPQTGCELENNACASCPEYTGLPVTPVVFANSQPMYGVLKAGHLYTVQGTFSRSFVCEKDADAWQTHTGYEYRTFNLPDDAVTQPCARERCVLAGGTLAAFNTPSKASVFEEDTWIGLQRLSNEAPGTWAWLDGSGFVDSSGSWTSPPAAQYTRGALFVNTAKYEEKFRTLRRGYTCQRAVAAHVAVQGKCTTALGFPADDLMFHLDFEVTTKTSPPTYKFANDGVLASDEAVANVGTASFDGEVAGKKLRFPGGEQSNLGLPCVSCVGGTGYPTKDFTVCLWIRTRPGTSGHVFTVDEAYRLVLGSNRVEFQGRVDAASTQVDKLSTPIVAGDWNHVCFALSAADITAYLNATKMASTPRTASEYKIYSTARESAGMVLMGISPSYAASPTIAQFEADSLMLFRRALDSAQIKVVMDNCDGPPAPAPTSTLTLPPTTPVPTPPTPAPPTP
eukprot:Sspe_Gene.107548::Locus_85744_Transcript_1_1_Confidence_1.000_Length_1787::g.107548::m.107548